MSKSEAGVVEYAKFLAQVPWGELRLAARKKRKTFHLETGKPVTGHDEVEIVSHEVLAELKENGGEDI